MTYLLQILVTISVYSILATSLNLLVGYTGLVSLCHAAFYGSGAYASTLLMIKVNVGFLPSMLLAVAVTMLLSLAISLPALRLRGDYFVLASLGFQMIAFAVIHNWTELTNGPSGISGIPRPKVFDIEIAGVASYAILTGVISLVCVGMIHLIATSPFGRVLKSIREDEIAAAALGKNVFRFKVIAFALAAGFASVAGSLLSGSIRYIDPTSFTLAESVLILSMIIIGGAGNVSGPLIGAAFMVILPEALRFAEIPEAIAANLRQIIYGVLIILVMRYRPRGLRGEYRFE